MSLPSNILFLIIPISVFFFTTASQALVVQSPRDVCSIGMFVDQLVMANFSSTQSFDQRVRELVQSVPAGTPLEDPLIVMSGNTFANAMDKCTSFYFLQYREAHDATFRQEVERFNMILRRERNFYSAMSLGEQIQSKYPGALSNGQFSAPMNCQPPPTQQALPVYEDVQSISLLQCINQDQKLMGGSNAIEPYFIDLGQRIAIDINRKRKNKESGKVTHNFDIGQDESVFCNIRGKITVQVSNEGQIAISSVCGGIQHISSTLTGHLSTWDIIKATGLSLMLSQDQVLDQVSQSAIPSPCN